jgi:basic amino acid/polyamine antiporter, APA family
MIGSGIFIVSADIARNVGSPWWLLVCWVITGLLTCTAALSYGELAAMMPKAGGQYVYLKEAYSPMWGFLWGWAQFLVIQTGTIAAVAVAFSRFLGVMVPPVSPTSWIIAPIHISQSYALSLSTQQLVAILCIALLTYLNTRGLRTGKLIQNAFTSTKTVALILLIILGTLIARNADVIASNFAGGWTPKEVTPIRPDFSFLPTVSATDGIFGLFIALCVAQVGSLFSADAWNNITFTAGEVKNPKRNLPLSLAIGTGLVITIYVLCNVAYLFVLRMADIQSAPDDRVATAALSTIFGTAGAVIMAVAIVISTFGCNNGIILAGARVYYAMAKDGLFFKKTAQLNRNHVPAVGLVMQGIWAAILVLPRTILTNPDGSVKYGNLYSNLLDYVIFAVLIFYALSILGIFFLRRKQPNAERPYKAFGYPYLPALYIAGATVLVVVLALYKTQTTWPGLLIVLSGIPVYFLWKKFGRLPNQA